MPVDLHWPEIAIRLACAVVASALLGLNRSEHGHAAGLRTSILVCLAACLAMIQVNLLLPLAGRSPNSFVMNDLMRLPLGILSGMGFIGAGAIVRRDNLVAGVTTAATLWLITVVGLCLGGGQIALGLVGAALGVAVLAGLKLVEKRMKHDRTGTLVVITTASGPEEAEIRETVQAEGFRIVSCGFAADAGAQKNELKCELRWRSKPGCAEIPNPVYRLQGREGVIRVEWAPQAR